MRWRDEALIQPSCVDNKFKLLLADNQMTADLFCLSFKPMKGEVALPKNAQLLEEVEIVEQLAEDFAAKVAKLKFSPAEIFSFLSEHRQSPGYMDGTSLEGEGKDCG